jgi:hypothetical protein
LLVNHLLAGPTIFLNSSSLVITSPNLGSAGAAASTSNVPLSFDRTIFPPGYPQRGRRDWLRQYADWIVLTEISPGAIKRESGNSPKNGAI